jgi:hypothetical protein
MEVKVICVISMEAIFKYRLENIHVTFLYCLHSKVTVMVKAGWFEVQTNQWSRVQIVVMSRVFVMNNYTCLRVMAIYVHTYISFTNTKR